MDKPLHNNAFSMLEMLLVLLIVSIFSMSFVMPKDNLTLFMQQLMQESILCQERAFLEKRRVDVHFDASFAQFDDHKISYPSHISCSVVNFYYNSKGNVSKASTIRCTDGNQKKKLIFQLGSGRVRIDEK